MDSGDLLTQMPMQVIAAPDPRLRQKSQPVSSVDDHCRAVMDRMIDLVRSQKALGLAAVQIGVDARIAVVNVGKDDQTPVPLFLVNPEIIKRSRQRVISEESCLSVPGYVGLIQRANEVTVRYLDYHGLPTERRASGLLAVCIQHEIDHLDGRLFTDHLSLSQRLARRWEELSSWRNNRRRQEPTAVVN
jgi:peptide deformylase